MFDPDPDARHKLVAVLAGARRALPGLSGGAIPPWDWVTLYLPLAKAVADADCVRESVPGQLVLTHRVWAGAQGPVRPERFSDR